MKVSNISSGAATIEPRAAEANAVAPPSSNVSAIDDRNATVVDKRGRVIGVKKLGALDRMKLFRAVGAEGCENRSTMHYATLAASVTSIDGVKVPFPHASLAIDAMIGRLDDEGLVAVVAALVALSPEVEDVAQEAQNF